MDRSHCQGCRENFYNGNNDLGVKECWSLKTATLVKRQKVHIDQVPPWKNPIKLYPSCYRVQHHVMVDHGKAKR